MTGIMIIGLLLLLFIAIVLCFILIISKAPLYGKEQQVNRLTCYLRYLPSGLCIFLWAGALIKNMHRTRDPLRYIIFSEYSDWGHFYGICFLLLICNFIIFAIWSRWALTSRLNIWGRRLYLSYMATVIAAIVLLNQYNINYYVLPSETDALVIAESREMYEYQPFDFSDDHMPDIKIGAPYPIMDGDPAVQPLYRALAEHLYDGVTESQINEIIPSSWQYLAANRLRAHAVDIVFAPEPLQHLDWDRVPAKYTKVARIPFIFFVNSENPVDGLTTAQIQDIYAGKMNHWNRLGGNRQKIINFQNYAESFSFVMMKNRVMQTTETEVPCQIRVQNDDDPAEFYYTRADYRNYENALGYTLLPHVWNYVKQQEVKLLEVDGVPATWENFMDDSYPYMVDIYALTVEGTEHESVNAILEWLTSEEGQRWVVEAGYFPI